MFKQFAFLIVVALSIVSLLAEATGQVRITYLSPNSGVAGSRVRIHGVGFTSSTIVKFGNVQAASVSVLNDHLLLAQVPVGATPGHNSVGVTVGTASSHTWPFAVLRQTVGTQNFVDQTPSRIPIMVSPISDLVMGDINGDLAPDFLTVGQSLLPEMLLVNNGNGFYTDEAYTQLAGINIIPPTGEFCDVDNDGDFDLVARLESYPPTRIFTNDGEGYFEVGSEEIRGFADIASGDLDNDGDIDLALARGGRDTLTFLFNDGSGVFPREVPLDVGIPVGSIALGDIDNDGDLDVLAGSYSEGDNSALLFINDGLGDFSNETSTRFPATPGMSLHVLFADVDGDGDVDVFLPKRDNQSQLLINNGLGFFSNEIDTRFPANPWCNLAKCGDIDGDGDLDIVTDSDVVFLNNGSGVFSSAEEPVLPRSLGGTMTLELADVNNDGHLDLFLIKGPPNPSRLCIGSAEGNNRAPVLVVSRMLIRPDDNFLFPLSATDADGDRLTFGAMGLPSGAAVNGSNGVFRWKPSFSDTGSHQVYLYSQDEQRNVDLHAVTTLVSTGTHDFNNVRMLMTADGRYAASPQLTGGVDGDYGFFPKATCNQYIFLAAPWIGGRVNTTPIVAQSHYNTEFASSEIRSTGERFRVFNSSIPNDKQKWPPEFSTSSGKPNIAPGAQNLVVQYNDVEGTPLGEVQRPLGIEIRQRSLEYADAQKGNALLLIWEVKNISSETIADAYFGFWADPDIGVSDEWDDRTSIVQDIGITWDQDFVVPEVSVKPAIVGVCFLETPNNVGMRNYVAFTKGGPNSDPNSDAAQYDFLSGSRQFETDWRGDVRMLVSTGPFNLAAGQSKFVSGAMLFGLVPAGTTHLATYPVRPDPIDPILADLLNIRREVQTFYDRELRGSRFLKETVRDGEITNESRPNEYALHQNCPNPFNPETGIRFELPEDARVVLNIFNTLGQEIRALVDAQHDAGYHAVRWDGKDRKGNAVSSGVYLYKLEAGSFVQVKKMCLVR